MTWVAVAVGGASLLGGYMQSQAATSAAQTQLQGTQYAADIQKQMFDVLNAQQAPYRQAGYNALNQIGTMLPSLTSMPTAQDIQNMPGYQFAVQQGTKAANQAANVLSPGSTQQQAIGKFVSDYTLGQAYPQFLNTRTNIYNTLAGIAGLGQVSTGQTSQLGQSTGQALSQLATGGATAVAGGQVGSANALAGGIQGIGNAALLSRLMTPSTQTSSPAISSNFMEGQFNPIA